MAAPIVFFDIAGNDDTTLRKFYSEIFGWETSEDGNFSIDVTSPLEATFRKDPAEKRIYIGVPNITETLKQVEAKGGSIDAPRFEVPGHVVLGLFKDPAGNEMGLVEMDSNQIRVP